MSSTSIWPYRLYRGIWSGLDLIFPPNCAGCGRAGYRVCPTCINQIRPLNQPWCERCGLPQGKPGLCAQCRDRMPSFEILRSWSAFEEPLRKILRRLKYQGDLSLGDELSAHFAGFIRNLHWTPGILIPIPLGRRRLAERGYNQAGMIGRPLAMALGIRYAPRGLARVRETRSQVGLAAIERHENVRGAFRADSSSVSGRSVLLLDDVATTGSTLSAAADALWQGGATHVMAATLARALPQHGLNLV